MMFKPCHTARHSLRLATLGSCMAVFALMHSANAESVRDQARLDDLAGQVEYAFYAQERTHLQQAVQALEDMAAEDHSAPVRLWLNYGRWKQAQLTAGTAAADVAARCASTSWSDKESVVVQAVGHALNAACAELLAALQPLRSVFHRRDRQREIQQALTLAPKQAQVQFIAAWIAQHNGDTKSAYQALRQAALMYDAGDNVNGNSRDAAAGDPGEWGQAEMFYLLGKLDIDRHDMLSARNALERALVLAPDYSDAAALIKTLSVR